MAVTYIAGMRSDEAVRLAERLSRANPTLVYEIRAVWHCGEPSHYVRVASRAEPTARRPRSVGPERAVAERGHRELDDQLELAYEA